jgi:hypothetical protein
VDFNVNLHENISEVSGIKKYKISRESKRKDRIPRSSLNHTDKNSKKNVQHNSSLNLPHLQLQIFHLSFEISNKKPFQNHKSSLTLHKTNRIQLI